MTGSSDAFSRPPVDHRPGDTADHVAESPPSGPESPETISAARGGLPVPLLDGERAQEHDDLTREATEVLRAWISKRAIICNHTQVLEYPEAADELMKVFGPRIAELRDQYEQLHGELNRVEQERNRYRDSLPVEVQDYWFWRHRSERAETDLAALRDGEIEPPTGRHQTAYSPGEWLHWFNRAGTRERLATIERIYEASRYMGSCIIERHQERLSGAEQAQAALESAAGEVSRLLEYGPDDAKAALRRVQTALRGPEGEVPANLAATGSNWQQAAGQPPAHEDCVGCGTGTTDTHGDHAHARAAWEADARRHLGNADYWRQRAQKAEVERDKQRRRAESGEDQDARHMRYLVAARDAAGASDWPSIPAAITALRSEAERRAEAAEGRARHAEHLAERGTEVHMRFGVWGEPDSVRCADWCHLCRVEKTEQARDEALAALQRARDFADDMRTWCSPHGVAADYAKRLLEVLDQHPDRNRIVVDRSDLTAALIPISRYIDRTPDEDTALYLSDVLVRFRAVLEEPHA